MSTKKEKYLKLFEDRKALLTRIGVLRSEILQLKESFGPDPEREILKLEILGDSKSAASKKAELREATARIAGLEVEAGKAEKMAGIMSELLPDLKVEARAELSEEWRERFAAAASPFVKKLEEVTAMERKLVQFRAEANSAFHSIGLGESPIRALPPFLLKMSGEYPTLCEWQAWAKTQGFDFDLR